MTPKASIRFQRCPGTASQGPSPQVLVPEVSSLRLEAFLHVGSRAFASEGKTRSAQVGSDVADPLTPLLKAQFRQPGQATDDFRRCHPA
ncbi:hypothetical protein C0214_06675 [Methylobacterium sp. DM1]|uniref:Uncharacterized protein n=2 Tax=Methylorubrum extorquens TaxID=408 RepID=C5B3R7_METEA|nr:conserved hypothetical protein [Methylorubrum extorquens AM1]AWI87993.1 hypothetical protein C0214_06675 [Methylobacterium sp. DM1]CAX22828.1 protein of unknown function [Methylorubrum extorquens DM4]